MDDCNATTLLLRSENRRFLAAKTDLMFASLFTPAVMTLLLHLAVTKASNHLSKR
jgi:hypothetical protein